MYLRDEELHSVNRILRGRRGVVIDDCHSSRRGRAECCAATGTAGVSGRKEARTARAVRQAQAQKGPFSLRILVIAPAGETPAVPVVIAVQIAIGIQASRGNRRSCDGSCLDPP
jgi:hypothetical protein